MNELIKISYSDSTGQTVNARELYKFLGIQKDFSNWIKRMLEYGFEEGTDYWLEVNNGRCDKNITPINKGFEGDNPLEARPTTFAQKGERSSKGFEGDNPLEVNARTLLKKEECSSKGIQPFNPKPKKEYVLTIESAKEIAMIQRSEKGKMARKYFIACEKQLLEQRSNKLPYNIPKTKIEALEQLLESEKKNKELQEKIAIDASKVELAESITASRDTILIRDFAKSISDEKFIIGERKLFQLFEANNILYKKNGCYIPYQEQINKGRFKVIERPITKPDRTIKIAFTTRITGKGQEYFTWRIKRDNRFWI